MRMLVLTPCLVRSFRDTGEALASPLLREPFRRPPTLSFARSASRRTLSDAFPRHGFGACVAVASRSTRESIPLQRFNGPPVGPLRPIPGCPGARRLIQGLRHLHHSGKLQQRPPYSPRSQDDSYRSDRSTLYHRAAQLTVLGTFLLVYLALHTTPQPGKGGSVLRPQKQPTPTSTSTLESVKHRLSTFRQSIQSRLVRRLLSYRPKDWPPLTLQQCAPYVGYMFAHDSPTHLAVNSLSFYFLTSYLFPTLGVLATATTFLAGAAATAYVNPRNPWHGAVAFLHASPRDPNPKGTLGSRRLGASAGLCAMFAVAAISNPTARWRFVLVPVGIPLWALWSGELAWEGYSFYNNVDDGIGHGDHLAGHLAGAVLWFVALRWTGYGRMCREMRRLRRDARYARTI